jgi:hypothetical protein
MDQTEEEASLPLISKIQFFIQSGTMRATRCGKGSIIPASRRVVTVDRRARDPPEVRSADPPGDSITTRMS